MLNGATPPRSFAVACMYLLGSGVQLSLRTVLLICSSALRFYYGRTPPGTESFFLSFSLVHMMSPTDTECGVAKWRHSDR